MSLPTKLTKKDKRNYAKVETTMNKINLDGDHVPW
jgi:hypothetical protein